MAYFVVERNTGDGCLRIPLPQAYETRDAAIAALSAATATGAVTLTGEVFIADLGAAVPVLVMQTVAPVATAPQPEEPEAEEQETVGAEELEEPAVVESGVPDEQPADAAFAAWAPLDEIPAEESTLADALKRAATSLEIEGIVAPESISAEPPSEVLVDVADEPAEGEQGATAFEGDLVDIGEPPIEAERTVGREDEATWPWANVESYEIPAESALEETTTEEILGGSKVTGGEEASASDEIIGPASAAALAIEPVEVEEPIAEEEPVEAEEPIAEEEPAEVEEPIAEEPTIITSAPADGEETYMPQPVILGDYPASEPVKDVEASAEPDSSVGSGPPFETGYAPTGEVDFGEYTCQDCVYSNTCPKVGQTSPAECGSFQWRSE